MALAAHVKCEAASVATQKRYHFPPNAGCIFCIFLRRMSLFLITQRTLAMYRLIVFNGKVLNSISARRICVKCTSKPS